MTEKEKLKRESQKKVDEVTEESSVVESTEPEVAVAPTPKKKPRMLSHDTVVEVMNNTSGRLVYVSPRSMITWVWEEYGSTDLMTIQELLTMRSSQSKFFTEQWVMVQDQEVIDYLKLNRYFEKTLTPDELEDFFYLPIDEMEKILADSNAGQKALIAATAKMKYENGTFADVNKIKMMERKLDYMIVTE